jgi:hypothetical protein
MTLAVPFVRLVRWALQGPGNVLVGREKWFEFAVAFLCLSLPVISQDLFLPAVILILLNNRRRDLR